MGKKYLVLGATGSMGFAFTNELLSKGTKATILVRNKQKAVTLFGRNKLLEIIEGDVTDLAKLKEVALNKDVIFHGINYPYQYWGEYLKPVTENIIEAAQQNRAVILFPDNIYAFGNTTEKITESSIPLPTTKKGVIRLELIEQLQNAANTGKVKVIVLRLPDFFGPNVTNGLIEPIFGNATKKKPIEWLINADIPHQFVYTFDAAKLFYLLSQQNSLSDYFLINFGGIVVPSLNSFGQLISGYTKGPNNVKVTSKIVLNILALFIPIIKELKENFYQFENTVLLDDSKILRMFPEFNVSPLKETVADTIDWFKHNQP